MRLAERVPEGQVFAVEPEKDMLSVLEAELGHLDGVEIIEDSALSYDIGMVARWRGDKVTVCGNLPYNVASQILIRVIEQRAHIRRGVFMIQREMADRLLASPGTKADVKQVIRVKPSAFVPPPKVESTVIRVDPLPHPRAPISDPDHYRRTVHAAFGQRRKTLRNALKARFPIDEVDDSLATTGIDGTRRGETLSIAELAALSSALQQSHAARTDA
jgi:16S rRNA (adenine1518-N6/adenine1519-N6)-dimethyltransferase